MDDIVNLNDINLLQQCDNLFEYIKDKYGPPPNWTRPQGFVTLAKIILEQHVSLHSANAHFNKLNNFLPEFIPDEICKLSDSDLKYCQISRQKSVYLKALSYAVLNKQLDFNSLSHLSIEEIRNELRKIKGIGDWTVDIYLMFAMQSKDVFPKADVAINTTMKELCNVKTKEEIERYPEKWKPFRSLAAFYLWHYYLKKRNRNPVQ